jgi:hypothetical protein
VQTFVPVHRFDLVVNLDRFFGTLHDQRFDSTYTYSSTVNKTVDVETVIELFTESSDTVFGINVLYFSEPLLDTTITLSLSHESSIVRSFEQEVVSFDILPKKVRTTAPFQSFQGLDHVSV